MPNKIAGFNLNNSPKSLNSEFYIAQPDGVKESLGGKLFMLLQSDAKRNDLIDLADFLVAGLDKYYYEDEKLILREKLDNLKVENIFEAMLAKINRDTSVYLEDNRSKFDLKTLSLTIGVAYNNEIYFSQIGNNKSFVIYKKEGNYETLKLNQDESQDEQENKQVLLGSLFSNVISGEIPSGSFFVLCNEALSEYILSETFKGIITNLPPLGASEQIKNKLKEINARVPFSGIIIKNTYGQSEQENYNRSEAEITTSLKQTEDKTAKLLSTAGLVNKDKLKQRFKKLKSLLQPKPKSEKVLIQKKDANKEIADKKETEKIDLDVSRLQLKDKIIMKKKPGLVAFFKKFSSLIPLIKKNSWPSAPKHKASKILNFRKKEKLIFSGIIALVLIFIVSILIINYQNKVAEEKLAYQEKVENIEKNQNQIESYLLYGNEESAKNLLNETKILIEELPREKVERNEKYLEFKSITEEYAQEIRHVINLDTNQLASLADGSQAQNIAVLDNNLYLANTNNNELYQINIDSGSTNTINLDYDASNLSFPAFDNLNNLYYLNNNNTVVQVLLPEQEVNELSLSLPNENAEISATEGYLRFFYVLDKKNSQIYKYNNNTNSLSFNANWINNPKDINEAVDMEIDSSIFILEKDGKISKFYVGEKEILSIDEVDPAISNATKLFLTDTYAYIYEKETNRVVQFEFSTPAKESLKFKNQYYFNNLTNISDISVDKDSNVYILDNNEVYQTSLMTK
jgi:hypothetical protein